MNQSGPYESKRTPGLSLEFPTKDEYKSLYYIDPDKDINDRI